jgi:hypothetical protein
MCRSSGIKTQKKNSLLGCPDPTGIWAGLWDRSASCDNSASARVVLVLHVNSLDADSVRAYRMIWLLEPDPFLQGYLLSLAADMCYVAAFAGLVGTSVTAAAAQEGAFVFTSGLVHREISSLALSPALRVAGVAPIRSAPHRVAEAAAPVG